MGEWISVKDRLPDEDGRYLVVAKLYDEKVFTVDTLYFTKDLEDFFRYAFPNCHRAGWVWYDRENDDFEENDSVTHWMPLPPLPEGVSAEKIRSIVHGWQRVY